MRYAFRLWKFIFFTDYSSYCRHERLILKIDRETFYDFLNGNFSDLDIFEDITE